MEYLSQLNEEILGRLRLGVWQDKVGVVCVSMYMMFECIFYLCLSSSCGEMGWVNLLLVVIIMLS